MPETRINTGFRHFNPVPGHTTLSSKGKIQYPHCPHIPQQSHTAKPSGTAAQFHSTFRSGNPDNPTSIASHITVSSYTAALSQCHFLSIIQSIPHPLQHQEISTFRSKLIIPGLSEPPVRTLRATIPENESHIFR